MSDEREGDDGKVIQFPVKFAPQGDDPAPQMQDADNVHDGRCRHRKTTFDSRARIITCDGCGANVDPFEVIKGITNWIRRNEWRYEEMQRASRESRLADDSHLLRVTQGTQSLLLGNCYVSGYRIGQAGIPTDAIALGDYVSRNRIYRARREGEAWTVAFWDIAHGLKTLPSLSRPTLAKVRVAVRSHWLWFNNNARAGGVA